MPFCSDDHRFCGQYVGSAAYPLLVSLLETVHCFYILFLENVVFSTVAHRADGH